MRSTVRLVLAVATVLAVAAAPVTAAPVDNYVDNPGFETFEDGDPVEWRVLAGDPSATTDADEGQQAVLFQLRGSEKRATIAQNVTQETDEAIVGGAEYEFDFAAKYSTGTSNDGSSAPNATGIVIWKNAAGEEVDRDVVVIEQGSYQDYNASFRAPADASRAEVRFDLERESLNSRTDATLKVDDVAFGPSDTQV